MMKKITTIMIMMFVMSMVAVMAAEQAHEPGTGIENPELKQGPQGNASGEMVDSANQVHEPGTGIENPELKQGPQGQAEPTLLRDGSGAQGEQGQKNAEMLQKGLQNALGKVKNENAKMRLQQNMEKFQQKYQNRLQNMTNVDMNVDEKTGAVTIKAKEQVKWFGFIKGKATKRFQMDEQGNINERAPWYRFMYAEQ